MTIKDDYILVRKNEIIAVSSNSNFEDGNIRCVNCGVHPIVVRETDRILEVKEVKRIAHA